MSWITLPDTSNILWLCSNVIIPPPEVASNNQFFDIQRSSGTYPYGNPEAWHEVRITSNVGFKGLSHIGLTRYSDPL